MFEYIITIHPTLFCCQACLSEFHLLWLFHAIYVMLFFFFVLMRSVALLVDGMSLVLSH